MFILQVIEFESLGVKVKNTKRFYVVNPTATGYDFEWKKLEAEKVNNSTDFSGFFKCTSNKGVILSGKKFEMVFEYTPELTGNFLKYKYQEPMSLYGCLRYQHLESASYS